MRLVELDKGNFDELVTDATCLVVVEFFSPGCGPCHALGALLEQMADDYPHVRFAAMDTVRFPMRHGPSMWPQRRRRFCFGMESGSIR